MDADLPYHPKVGRLAAELGVSRVEALGHLLTLWAWVWRFRPDGDLTGLTAAEIAEAAGVRTGDAQVTLDAFVAAQLVDRDSSCDRVAVHQWMQYQGKSERARIQHNARQAKYRAARDKARRRKGDASVTVERHPSVTPASRRDETRRDKTRETPDAPPTAAARGPSRELRDHLSATWREAEGDDGPTWTEADWSQLARLHRRVGEQRIREAWPRFLAGSWPPGHPLRVFASMFDRWAARASPGCPDVRLGEHRGPPDPEAERRAELEAARLRAEREAREHGRVEA